jgi:hypothetical protein
MSEQLTERLASLEADVRNAVRLAPADVVRARGDRRWWSTRAFAAIVAVVAAGGLGVGGVAINVGARPDPSTALPAGFEMPHEGERGWVRDDDRAAAVAFNPCDKPDVTQDGRVAARTMTGRAFPDDPYPVQLIQQLLLYADENAARDAMAGLRAWTTHDPAGECGWIGGVYRGPHDLGPEVLWSGTQVPGAGWRDALVARYGRAVYVLRAAGTVAGTPYNEDLDSTRVVRERLCAQLSICVLARTAPPPTDPGPGPEPAPSWWDFLQTPHATPYDPWDNLNPNPNPTPT